MTPIEMRKTFTWFFYTVLNQFTFSLLLAKFSRWTGTIMLGRGKNSFLSIPQQLTWLQSGDQLQEEISYSFGRYRCPGREEEFTPASAQVSPGYTPARDKPRWDQAYHMLELQQDFAFPFLQTICPNLSSFLPAGLEEAFPSLARGPLQGHECTPALHDHIQPSCQLCSPFFLDCFCRQNTKKHGSFSHAGWAPCPSSRCWAGAFPRLWLQRAGEGTDIAGQHWLSLMFASRCPGKQRENKECSSQKLKLVRVTSTVQELGFSFSWGFPQFCNGLLFFTGSKPESFGISYKTKLGKDK